MAERSGFKRAAVRVALFAVVIPFALCMIVLLLFRLSRSHENAAYADAVFDGVVPVQAVLASRRWHPIFGGWGIDCTYAVVELASGAPAAPPDASQNPRDSMDDYWIVFAGDWQPTPAPPFDNGDTSMRHRCEGRIGSALFDRIEAARATPGGWWWSNSETLFFYSKSVGIAARIRYSD